MSLSATPTVRTTSSATEATGSGTQQQHRKSQDRPTDPSVDKTSSIVISVQESPINATIAARQPTGHSMAGSVCAVTRIRPTRTTAKRRHKVKEFNDAISCYLCNGYLVNATTIDYCVHSYCRSCIVRHLQEDKHCPQCRPGGKQISLSNLKTDERLKSIVYKLVPGLFQNEHQKQVQFYSDASATRGEDQDEVLLESDEDYFSPVEPISLSLEYHPKCLQGCDRQQIPPIRYLQCPAAVTVHHLKRFISSKFDIDPDNARVDIEIIYEDEILPEDFSLMDVGYCYSWKRVAPMRFFYRILVHTVCNTSSQVIPSDSVLSESDNVVEAKRAKKSNEAGTQKTVRFKDVKQSTEKPTGTTVQEESKKLTEKEAETKYTIFKTKSIKSDEIKEAIAISNNNNNNSSTKADHNVSSKTTEIEVTDDGQINGGFGPVKMTINMKKSNEIKSKHPDGSKTKSKSKIVSSVPGTDDIPMAVINDFKSLRSNDQKYNDYTVNTVSSAKSKCSASKGKNSTHKESTHKPQVKVDANINAPKTHSHRTSVSSSDDSLENLSLAQLKSANKKAPTSSFVTKPNSSAESSKSQKKEEKEKHGVELPRLKIELPSLKTKITVPKKSPEIIEPKKTPKIRKRSSEELQSPAASNQVDLTTYAKNIGLKPIKPAAEESSEKKETKPVISPDKSPFSTSSSNSSPPSSSGSAFIFSVDGVVSSSHKKRKKAKHSKESKEPGSSKRRKLHAEISSQPADESLKLKVKITGNHKLYKSEKKSSSTSTPEDVVPTPFVTLVSTSSSSPSITTTETAIPSVKIIAPKSPLEPSTMTKNPTENKHGVRNNLSVNIPNLNKTLSEESTNINNLISENSAPKQAEPSPLTTTKGQTFSKAKPATSLVPKTIPMVSVPLTTISQMTMSSNPSAVNQPKAMPVKILSIQEAKIPVSPPLPPSLFKTTPMSLQTMTSTTPKQTVMQSQTKNPQQSDMKNTAMAQLKRLAGSGSVRPQGNFAIPNPPRSTGITRHGPITSIASAAHRQAQLKRSASLDSSPANFTKQQKLDHDRAVRKSAYTPFLIQNCTTQATTSTSASGNSNVQTISGVKTQKASSPVVSSSSSNNVKTAKVTEQQSFYTSTMAPSYTHELVCRKSTSILLSAPTLSVAKVPDIVAPKMTYSTPAVTITPQQQPLPPTPYQQQQQQKPALEIVRISSNIPPIDQQQLTITNNNTVKQTPQKTTRPPPPPIPLVKIKRTANQPTPLKATLTTVSPPVQQAQISSNAKPTPSIPITTASDTTITAVASKVPDALASNDKPTPETNGPLDLSGKSSRSPSQEKTSPAISPPDTPTQNSVKDTQTIKRQMANNLEAALSKLKQQNSITTISSSASSTQVTSTTFAPSMQTVKSPVTTETPVVSTSSMTLTVPKLTDTSSGLQNLKLLSDSATIREKLTLKRPMLPKLNEINKMRTNPPVRQQNASVRNIPNPSALAFRSHQQMPMLASITKTTSPQKSVAITTSTTTTTTAASTTPSFLNSSDKALDSTIPVTSSHITVSISPSVSKSDVITTTVSSSSSAKMSTFDPPKIVALKKNVKSIDQLAANLNLRAAAAAIADNASKASATSTNLSTNTTTETTTTSTTETTSNKAVSPSTTTPVIPTASDITTGTTTLSSGTPVSTGGPVAVTSSTPAPISASTA